MRERQKYVQTPEFENKHIRIIGGTTKPEQSAIHFIGEVHDDPFTTRQIGLYLKHFAKPGDILLIEGNINEQVAAIKRRHYLLLESIQIQSWDSMKFNNLARNGWKDAYSSVVERPMETDFLISRRKLYDNFRDEEMIRNVKALRKIYPNQQIFVVAGKQHIRDNIFIPQLNEHYALLDVQDEIDAMRWIPSPIKKSLKRKRAKAYFSKAVQQP